MANAFSVNPNLLIEEAAKKLRDDKLVSPPVWSGFAKTGAHKDRPPRRTDWWYVRSAAVLRSVYRLGPVGTNKLRTKYGGRKNRGVATEIQVVGSGSVARKILQQLEKSGLVKQENKAGHKGRVITPKGKSLLDKIAIKIHKEEKAQAKVQ